MAGSLSTSLAELHAEFNVFPLELFGATPEQNIINRVAAFPELVYLQEFYRQYEEIYRKAEIAEIQPLVGAARSVDLPFAGELVVNTERAKYMFVFLGALSPPHRLSNTVLSCLWPIEQMREFRRIFATFWPQTYDKIVEKFGITADVARKSYVVDAFRIGNAFGNPDRPICRALLHREIDLLKPELIVLVGKEAGIIMGHDHQRPNFGTYFQVPFPRAWLNEEQIAAEDPIYAELRSLIRSMEDQDMNGSPSSGFN